MTARTALSAETCAAAAAISVCTCALSAFIFGRSSRIVAIGPATSTRTNSPTQSTSTVTVRGTLPRTPRGCLPGTPRYPSRTRAPGSPRYRAAILRPHHDPLHLRGDHDHQLRLPNRQDHGLWLVSRGGNGQPAGATAPRSRLRARRRESGPCTV